MIKKKLNRYNYLFSFYLYFLERCSGESKSGDFWKTVKPFFSKKGSSGEQKIVLNESDKMVKDQKEIANHFNNFFLYCS